MIQRMFQTRMKIKIFFTANSVVFLAIIMTMLASVAHAQNSPLLAEEAPKVEQRFLLALPMTFTGAGAEDEQVALGVPKLVAGKKPLLVPRQGLYAVTALDANGKVLDTSYVTPQYREIIADFSGELPKATSVHSASATEMVYLDATVRPAKVRVVNQISEAEVATLSVDPNLAPEKISMLDAPLKTPQTPLLNATSSDTTRRAHLDAIAAALERYAKDRGSYLVPAAFDNSGQGWVTGDASNLSVLSSADSYSRHYSSRSIVQELREGGYLTGGSYLDPKNGAVGYLLYLCDDSKRFSLSAKLDITAPADDVAFGKSCNSVVSGAPPYGMNYAVSGSRASSSALQAYALNASMEGMASGGTVSIVKGEQLEKKVLVTLTGGPALPVDIVLRANTAMAGPNISWPYNGLPYYGLLPGVIPGRSGTSSIIMTIDTRNTPVGSYPINLNVDVSRESTTQTFSFPALFTVTIFDGPSTPIMPTNPVITASSSGVIPPVDPREARLREGLVLHWNFEPDDLSGDGLTIYDKSGHGNKAVIVKAGLTTPKVTEDGRFGRGLEFFDKESYLDLSNVSISDPFTLSAWFKTKEDPKSVDAGDKCKERQRIFDLIPNDSRFHHIVWTSKLMPFNPLNPIEAEQLEEYAHLDGVEIAHLRGGCELGLAPYFGVDGDVSAFKLHYAKGTLDEVRAYDHILNKDDLDFLGDSARRQALSLERPQATPWRSSSMLASLLCPVLQLFGWAQPPICR